MSNKELINWRKICENKKEINHYEERNWSKKWITKKRNVNKKHGEILIHRHVSLKASRYTGKWKSIKVIEINQNGSNFGLAKPSDVVSRVTKECFYFREEVLQW